MTIDDALAVVRRITYCPGWRIECYHEPLADVLVLRCGRDEPDSERPQATLSVVLTDSCKRVQVEGWDEAGFLLWVYGVFKKRVIHELNEWLRLDGVPLVEPHPETGWNRGVLTGLLADPQAQQM